MLNKEELIKINDMLIDLQVKEMEKLELLEYKRNNNAYPFKIKEERINELKQKIHEISKLSSKVFKEIQGA